MICNEQSVNYVEKTGDRVVEVHSIPSRSANQCVIRMNAGRLQRLFVDVIISPYVCLCLDMIDSVNIFIAILRQAMSTCAHPR